MKQKIYVLVSVYIAVACILCVRQAVAESATDIVTTAGVKGGLIVHLGCGDGTLTTELHVNDRYLVHGLDTSLENIRRAREHIQAKKLAGQVSVDMLRSDRLPYVDNMVNLLVAEDLGGISMEEVMRVLVPDGAAYIKKDGEWTKTVKSRPEEIDEWTHFLHGPDGNAVRCTGFRRRTPVPYAMGRRAAVRQNSQPRFIGKCYGIIRGASVLYFR